MKETMFYEQSMCVASIMCPLLLIIIACNGLLAADLLTFVIHKIVGIVRPVTAARVEIAWGSTDEEKIREGKPRCRVSIYGGSCARACF
jgi:hypothetical protein